jgi:transporter family-2 protein
MLELVLWSLFAVVGGICIALQAPLNAALGQQLGFAPAAAASSFIAGSILLVVVTLVWSRTTGTAIRFSAPPWWLFIVGGCLGTVYVVAAIVLTPKIGTAAVMGLVVTGQLLMGLLLDRVGFMGSAVRELSLGRVTGALLLVAGAVMLRTL